MVNKKKNRADKEIRSGKKPVKASPDRRSYSASDIEQVPLTPDIADAALAAGGFPYDKKIPRKEYERDLRLLQIELVKLQDWVKAGGERIVILFEGRDAAGKGSTIKRFTAHLNARHTHVVALAKPTETEQGQWYFQRYVNHLPAAGDMAFFDRSWYNRAGVEPVMGFCTPDQTKKFLEEVPDFEAALVRDGIRFFKFWLTIGQETQLERFHERRHNPLKRWKLSDIDLIGIERWDDYTRAAKTMFEATHRPETPWTVIRANDQRRARLNAMRVLLSALPYTGKDETVVAAPDPKIVCDWQDIFR